MTELDDHLRTLVKVLPGGIRQRVALASSLLHDPEILFLDEPTAGVDPLLRKRFWEIIDGLSAAGTTIFITTHYMDEVEHCHKIALMVKGRIIEEGTLAKIKSSAFPEPLFQIDTEDVVRAFGVARELLKSSGKYADCAVSIHGSSLHIFAGGPAAAIPGRDMADLIMQKLEKASIPCTPPEPIEPGMDDVFVHLVKRYENLPSEKSRQ